MIWLSSYPRSGNTFLRNILFEVYGLSSSSFYENKGEPENYLDFPFVKTHMRPGELIPDDENIPAVYLLRDGRDALVSMAHQRKDLYDPGSDFRENFIEAMVAAEGSYFGGWSINVEEWLERAALIIRFEDLISEPFEQVERIRAIADLPPGDKSKLPTFEAQKFGTPKYGRGKRIATSEQDELEIIRKSFRKGKAFGWLEELDRELQNLFWSYHRNVMEKVGYTREGGVVPPNPDLDYKLMKLLGSPPPPPDKKYKVLIEANKLLMHQNDGVKRYLLELLKALYPLTQNPDSRWQIDIYLRGRVHALADYGKNLFDVNKSENHYRKFTRISKAIKGGLKLFVPKAYHDSFSNYFKKVVMKAGLKFTKTLAGLRFAIERLRSGSDVARESFETHTGNVKIGRYDLVHVPLPQHFEPFVETNNRYLVTVHDLTHQLYGQYHTSSNIELAEKGHAYFERQKADYICISNSTRSDMRQYRKVDDAKLHTILEAADSQKFKPNLNDNKGLFVRSLYQIPSEPFLFTLSTLEPRKNLLNTIKAFEELVDENPGLNINLVIGGKNGWKSRELLKLKHRKRIFFTGFIDENDLPVLYNESEALCYISFYEGFGLPPLEAMSCKTPVIYGNNSSLKELLEGYGLPADPQDISSIKEQMLRLLTEPGLKEKLAESGLERTFDFSWRNTAIQTLEVYEKLITKSRLG